MAGITTLRMRGSHFNGINTATHHYEVLADYLLFTTDQLHRKG